MTKENMIDPMCKASYVLGTECMELAGKLRHCGLAGIANDLLRVGHELQDGLWDRVVYKYLEKEA